MKLQSLAVMFIILILPISLILASYTQNRVETLNLQTQYDSKLKDATYDALKAYQLNSLNSDTSDLANSKIRNIEASVNTFFNTMATNFSSIGYTKQTLQNYIPALVYTMYDGYYIYSPFTNTWDKDTKNIVNKQKQSYEESGETYSSPYENDKKLYGIKPYVYYSCRYKKNDKNDIIITYSLDNYIQIQGIIGGNTISKYGYLLDFDQNDVVNDSIVKYKGHVIDVESPLTENIYINGEYKENMKYIKRNGTKYYTDGTNVFSVLNGKSRITSDISVQDIEQNNNAKKYYQEAYELKKFIQGTTFLRDLTTNDIVNTTDDSYSYYKVGKIFDFNNIESETSNFNTHRIDVIKNSIERNLSIVISNFNRYTNSTTDFQMPKLKDIDFDKIMDNISIISFMQGINIGGKVYNGYSIITNTKNEDVVMEDSIYIQNKADNVFHRVTEEGLSSNNIVGIYNVNLERRSAQNVDGNIRYYFPIYGTLSYDSIVTQNKVVNKTIQECLNNNDSLAKVYYTALGRERYGLYRQKLEIDNTSL